MSTKKEKKPNYSKEQEAALINAVNIASLSYESQSDILEDLADNNPLFKSKTKNQLSAKLAFLSKAGACKQVDNSPVYVHKTYATKTGGSVIRKSDLVEQIAEKCNCASEVLESLEKATKSALLIVLGSLTELNE